MRSLVCLFMSLLILNCESTDSHEQKYDPLEDGKIKIALYSDEGAHISCITAAEKMFEWMEYEVERVYADSVNYGNIKIYDLFYFPGGSSSFYREKINEEGRDKLRSLIDEGRGFIGTCAGAITLQKFKPGME
ncbi:MAG: hypothetical protein JXR48_03820 [Candidatus Delongbacteria bacterium]|nr:hypothetical protein [Candidatus Delongbacteria bacterium]MBN2834074.1 hypothetical protein [Candidatus Delongbacteria bacterium]